MSEWGYGKGRHNIGWSVYRDGKEVSWGIVHPLSRRGAKGYARWFAWREMIGWPSPRFTLTNGRYRVVAGRKAS